jgi:hypothetical protein
MVSRTVIITGRASWPQRGCRRIWSSPFYAIMLCVTLGNNPRKKCGMAGLTGLQAHEELRP